MLLPVFKNHSTLLSSDPDAETHQFRLSETHFITDVFQVQHLNQLLQQTFQFKYYTTLYFINYTSFILSDCVYQNLIYGC